MNQFSYQIKTLDFESAKMEIEQQWKAYCTDADNNPLLAEIQETQNLDELKNICSFLRSLSILLNYIDPVGRNYDYAAYLESLAGAVRANEFKLGGAVTTSDDDVQIKKYALDN